MATPPEFPKGIPGYWSPEHLFTAAVSNCFLSTTFLAIAENSKLSFSTFKCESKRQIWQLVEGKYLMTEIIFLEPYVTILDEEDRAKAERLLQKAEAACLISNSINSKVILNTNINLA